MKHTLLRRHMKRTLRTWIAIFAITTLIVPGAPTLLMATAGDASAARFSGNSRLCTEVMLNMMLPSDSMKWLAAWW